MPRPILPFRMLPLMAVLCLPAAVLAQGSPTGGDEAMNAINSNFARMTPSPRTVDSINQELRQNHATPAGGSGMRGGGRGRGRQRTQDSSADANAPASPDGGLHTSLPGTSGAAGAPAPAVTQVTQ